MGKRKIDNTTQKMNEVKKIFLRSYRFAEREYNRRCDEFKEFDISRKSPSSGGFEVMTSHGTNNDMAQYCAIKEEYAKKAYAAECVRNRNYKWIIEQLNRLQEQEYDILFKRYINKWPWQKMEETMHNSLRNLYYLHGNALLNLSIPSEATVRMHEHCYEFTRNQAEADFLTSDEFVQLISLHCKEK